jgi:transcriptional regulator with XRE-family HTH domain
MAERDYKKAQRLNEVYKYLFAHDKVKSQTDFADKLKVQRTGLSAAMNGVKANLTKNLFMKICASFPGVFNLDYLLTGEGAILADEQSSDVIEKTVTSPTDEMTANILEMYARMIRGVDDLRIQLKEELEEVKSIKSELQQARDGFRDATYRLNIAMDRLINNNQLDLNIAAETTLNT